MRGALSTYALALTLPLLGSLACSSHDASAPATSPDAVGSGSSAPLLIPALADANTGMLVAFDLAIDRTNGSAELTPRRLSQAVGDTFSEIGLAPAFTELFGKNFRVVGLRSTGPTTIDVDFEIVHPFTVAKRPDLAIFNTKCWVVTDRPGTTLGSITGVPNLVTNADGHGTMWSDTAAAPSPLTTVQVQPYVILNEDPSSAPFDWHAPAGFNVLFPEQSSVDTVSLDLGGANTLNLHIYLTADYGQSAIRATRQNPQYELPKFAGNAPWKIAVTETANTLEAGNTASNATWQVDIWDWKHCQSLGSDVTGATVNIPALIAAPQPLTLSGTGQDPTPLTATATVLNSLNASGGDYWGLVTVTDEGTGTGLKEDLATPVALGTYTTYQWFPVTVGAVSTVPTTANITTVGCSVASYKLAQKATLSGSTSVPGTLAIATYEWDFDYDGSNFTLDASGVQVMRPNATAGTFNVALRVTDTGTNSDLAITTVTVSATPLSWQPVTRVTMNAEEERFDNEGSDTICVAPDGTVHLIYVGASGAGYFVKELTYGGCPAAWSAPQTIVPASVGNFYAPSTEATPDGAIHVVFGTTTGNEYDYTTYTGGTWSTPIQLFTVPVGASWRFSKLASTPSGKLGALGVAHASQGCSGSPATPSPILFREKNGATWSAQTQIAGADTVFDIAGCGGATWWNESADIEGLPDNEWLVAWENLPTPYTTGPVAQVTQGDWIRTTGGVWGSVGVVYPSGPYVDELDLARSPNGLVWMLFRRDYSAHLALAQYNGTTWSASPADVMLGSAYPNPAIGFGADGGGAVYAAPWGGTGPVVVKRFAETDTLAAIVGLPTDTPQAVPAYDRNLGRVVPLGDGRVMAFWRTSQFGTGSLYEIASTTYE
ncbi:MAG: PKD domain-containing protein [bacterium]